MSTPERRSILYEIKGQLIDFQGLPWGFAYQVIFALQDERCSPDTVLILADGLDRAAANLGPTISYTDPLLRTATAVRDLAPLFDKALPHDLA